MFFAFLCLIQRKGRVSAGIDIVFFSLPCAVPQLTNLLEIFGCETFMFLVFKMEVVWACA